MEFTELNLHPDLLKGVEEAGYKTCMPVQEKVFPNSFQGKDIYAQSQTGTGKTAAFLISIFQRIMTVPEDRARKVLILSPTRELAVQTEQEAEKLGKYLNIKIGAFYGGVSYGPQEDSLRNNVQMIIGTPGRIIDFVEQGKMLLKDVGFLVIDEADRMFDMGFIDDLRKLIRYLPPPGERQTFLFSATLGLRIKDLAWEYMIDPVEITIEPEHVTVDLVTQELYHVGSQEKMSLLLGLLAREKAESVLIFCNQKFMCEELAKRLRINGYDCEYIMGDLPQSKRLQIIDDLKAEKLHYLVATDVAARGLDIGGLDLVINYDLPDEPESYVHRIGRTARAGKAGKAISLACEKFVYNLPGIERFLGQKIPVMHFDESLLLEDKSAHMRIPRDDDRRGGRDSGGGRSSRDSGRRSHDAAWSDRGRDSGRRDHRDHDYARSGSASGGRGHDDDRDYRDSHDSRGSRRGAPKRDYTQNSGARAGQRPTRSPAKAGQEGAQGGNPYTMSQDERLKMYREKYGKGLEQQPRGSRQSSKNGGQKPARQQKAGPAAKGTAARAAVPAKKPGLFERIKKLFGGKKH